MKTAIRYTLAAIVFAVVVLLILSSTTYAGVCPPDFTHDGITVDPTCAGLGQNIYAVPGTFTAALNDNHAGDPGNDGDFNDQILNGFFSPVIKNGKILGVVTLSGSLSAWDDVEEYNGVAMFSNSHPGTFTFEADYGSIVPLGAFVNDPVHGLQTYITGPDGGDGSIHYWVSQTPSDPPCPTPEPGTAVVMSSGLGLMFVAAVISRRKSEKK